MDNYIAALFLPHTEENFFPSVMAKIRGWRGPEKPSAHLPREAKA
jgi:hypothetical protein